MSSLLSIGLFLVLFSSHVFAGTENVVYLGMSDYTLCSGSFIKSGGKRYLITAAHCVNRVNGISVWFGKIISPKKVEKKGKVIMTLKVSDFTVDVVRDFALYQLPENQKLPPEAIVRELRSSALQVGERTEVIGYGQQVGPQNLACSFVEHNVRHSLYNSMTSNLDCEYPYLGEDNLVNNDDGQGFSGGPVVDSEDRLVGIVSSGGTDVLEGQKTIFTIIIATVAGDTLREGFFYYPANKKFSVTTKARGFVSKGTYTFCTDELGALIGVKYESPAKVMITKISPGGLHSSMEYKPENFYDHSYRPVYDWVLEKKTHWLSQCENKPVLE